MYLTSKKSIHNTLLDIRVSFFPLGQGWFQPCFLFAIFGIQFSPDSMYKGF